MFIKRKRKRKRKNLPLFPERGFSLDRKSLLRGNQYRPQSGQEPVHAPVVFQQMKKKKPPSVSRERLFVRSKIPMMG
jgi:hypothetical protein